MPNQPQQITITFTPEQVEQLEELKKISGQDTTNVIRTAITDLHQKVMADEEGKKIAKINALLDVQ
jgi:guanylate kinase